MLYYHTFPKVAIPLDCFKMAKYERFEIIRKYVFNFITNIMDGRGSFGEVSNENRLLSRHNMDRFFLKKSENIIIVFAVCILRWYFKFYPFFF